MSPSEPMVRMIAVLRGWEVRTDIHPSCDTDLRMRG
jgi:hypothetical protein